MTAEQELPGVDEYAGRLADAHRASTWPGIPPADDPAPAPPVQIEPPHPADKPTDTSHSTQPTVLR